MSFSDLLTLIGVLFVLLLLVGIIFSFGFGMKIITDSHSLKTRAKLADIRAKEETTAWYGDGLGNFPILKDNRTGQFIMPTPGNSPYPAQFLTITGQPNKFNQQPNYTTISDGGNPRYMINNETGEAFERKAMAKSTPKSLAPTPAPDIEDLAQFDPVQEPKQLVQANFELNLSGAKVQGAAPSFIAREDLELLAKIYEECKGADKTQNIQNITGVVKSGASKKWKTLSIWWDSGCPLD